MISLFQFIYRYIFNIETLLFISLIIVMLYFYFFNKVQGVKMLSHIKSILISSESIKNKEKIKKKYGKYEQKCRDVFESIFQKKFPCVRPTFLRNPKTGNKLELDGYNSSIITPIGMGLAFEYDGLQHFQYVKKFHNNKSDLTKQIYNDNVKNICLRNKKIVLIRIPYTIKYNDIKSYITSKLQKLHFTNI